MLTIETQGARALLNLLQSTRAGSPPGVAELEAVLSANAFFVDFYSRWEGSSREAIKEALRDFDQPEQLPAGLLARLAEGFRQALDELDLIQARLDWLSTIDPSGLAEGVLTFLPPGTPLDSVIHVTVDAFNNAFAHRGEMGVSLLKGMPDRQAFTEVISHEMHHVGFRYWSARDAPRQQLVAEKSGRSVAVLHVENLLMEGMANYYCTPGYVFGEAPAETLDDAYQARLARLRCQEGALFSRAGAILAMCLEPGAVYEACMEAYNTIALDLQDFMLPAGHYLGARMLQVMDQFEPRARIIACVQRLPEFLPRYNQAAAQAGVFLFDSPLVERFTSLWSPA
jgi:hypothetical protein